MLIREFYGDIMLTSGQEGSKRSFILSPFFLYFIFYFLGWAKQTTGFFFLGKKKNQNQWIGKIPIQSSLLVFDQLVGHDIRNVKYSFWKKYYHIHDRFIFMSWKLFLDEIQEEVELKNSVVKRSLYYCDLKGYKYIYSKIL